MYDARHINGTWGSKEVRRLRELTKSSKPKRRGPSFLEGVDPSRHHVLKKKTYHFLDISLHSTKGCSRYKTKVKVKNNFIQLSPTLIKNTEEIIICENQPLSFLADVICTQSLKVM